MRFARLALAVPVALLLLAGPRPVAAGEVTVFAAASLADALGEVNEAFREEGGEVVASFAGSSALARQIEAGAPADVFVSADLDWMDWLQQRGLVDGASRRDLLGNRLVLVASATSGPAIEIRPGLDLAGALGDGRLAIGETASVPAGRYGRAALEALGVWEGVADRLAEAENVRAALALVARGEAPLGLVYATDAAADPSVEVVATLPEESHPPIVYPVALIAGSGNPDAGAYLDFLLGERARGIFEAAGFTVLPPG